MKRRLRVASTDAHGAAYHRPQWEARSLHAESDAVILGTTAPPPAPTLPSEPLRPKRSTGSLGLMVNQAGREREREREAEE